MAESPDVPLLARFSALQVQAALRAGVLTGTVTLQADDLATLLESAYQEGLEFERAHPGLGAVTDDPPTKGSRGRRRP